MLIPSEGIEYINLQNENMGLTEQQATELKQVSVAPEMSYVVTLNEELVCNGNFHISHWSIYEEQDEPAILIEGVESFSFYTEENNELPVMYIGEGPNPMKPTNHGPKSQYQF